MPRRLMEILLPDVFIHVSRNFSDNDWKAFRLTCRQALALFENFCTSYEMMFRTGKRLKCRPTIVPAIYRYPCSEFNRHLFLDMLEDTIRVVMRVSRELGIDPVQSGIDIINEALIHEITPAELERFFSVPYLVTWISKFQRTYRVRNFMRKLSVEGLKLFKTKFAIKLLLNKFHEDWPLYEGLRIRCGDLPQNHGLFVRKLLENVPDLDLIPRCDACYCELIIQRNSKEALDVYMGKVMDGIQAALLARNTLAKLRRGK